MQLPVRKMAENSILPNKIVASNSTQQLPADAVSSVSEEVSMDHSYNLTNNAQATASNNPVSGPSAIESPEVYSVIPLGSLQMLDDSFQPKKLGNNLDASNTGQESMEQSFTTSSLHSETSSLDETLMEEVPLSDRMSHEEELAPRRSRRQKIPVDKDFPPSYRQKRSYKTSPLDTNTKRPRISKCNSYKKFIESHDKDALLEILSEEVDGEKLLEVYKKNRSTKEVQEQASKVLELYPTNVSTNPDIVSMLKTSLAGFSKLIPKEVYMDILMENISDKLEATRVLKFLKPEQIKQAILQTITDKDLLGMLFKSNSPAVYKKILETVPDDAIIKQVEARTNLNASETLLNILLENYSKIVPEEPDIDSDDVDSVPVKPTSQIALMGNLTNAVDSKPYLNKLESLLNVMLQKGPDVYSMDTKKNIEIVLQRKFTGPEFNELSYKVTKYHFAGRVVELD